MTKMNAMIILLITTLCLHSAVSSPLAEEENKEGRINDVIRTTFSSGGSLFLGLNSTVLWVAVLGLGVLGLATYLLVSSGLLGGDGSSGFGYNQRYSNYYDPDLQAANSPTALAALAYAQEAQAAQQSQSARSKRALDESKFKIFCTSINK